MANLAEAAAAAIGADALTRVGAYYHDLGKSIQPKYFVENLAHGERSPRRSEPEVSADAIMAHVVQGTKLLRDGASRARRGVRVHPPRHAGHRVLLAQVQGARNPKGLKEEFFRYPGMRPQTKETAILMLVDSIEAASRTISPPDRGKFEEMIQRIIFTKLKSGQLDESGLTLDELKTLTTKMADTLVNMYHGRIKYPWQEKGAATAKPDSDPSAKSDAPQPAAAERAPATEKTPEAASEKPSERLPLPAIGKGSSKPN